MNKENADAYNRKGIDEFDNNNILGLSLYELNKCIEACDAYDLALKFKPNDTEILINKGTKTSID